MLPSPALPGLLPSSVAALNRLLGAALGGLPAGRCGSSSSSSSGSGSGSGGGTAAATRPLTTSSGARGAGGGDAAQQPGAPPQEQQQQQQQQQQAAAGGAARPRDGVSADEAAVLLSEEGGARLCRPESGDVPAAAARAPSLRLLQRYYGVSAPGLRGQAVLARVIRAGAGGALLDPGYYGLSPLPARDLGAPQLYSERGAPLPARDGGGGGRRPRLRRGSHLKVVLGDLFTPYGDVELKPVRVRPEVRAKLVWGELQARMQRGSPVWGRVLNPVAGGYAVGVAGYVALLPSRQASVANIRAIGGLQQFYIHRMEERGRVIELSNYTDGGVGGGGGGGARAADRTGEGAPSSLWSNL
ncbi:MAG: hypothetical protein J3K34DRAFT_381671 [Monoraphidium minutum]|nr:MAG: hypothetical protein J3K34DRAFT_381671 [Monoraphidium minutum]